MLLACRAEYNPKSDLLDQEFMLKGKLFQRKDVEVRIKYRIHVSNWNCGNTLKD